MSYKAPDGRTYSSKSSYDRAKGLGYTRPKVPSERRGSGSSATTGYKAPDGKTYASRTSYERAQQIRSSPTPEPRGATNEITQIDTQQAAEESRTRAILAQYGSQAVQSKYEVELRRPEGVVSPIFIAEEKYDPSRDYGRPVVTYPTEVEGFSKEEVAQQVSQQIPGMIEESYAYQVKRRKEIEVGVDAYGSKAVQQKAYESGLTQTAPEFTFMEGVKSELTPKEVGKDVGIGFAVGGTMVLIGAVAPPVALVGGAVLLGTYIGGTILEYKSTPEQQRAGFLGAEVVEFGKFGFGMGKGGKTVGQVLTRGWKPTIIKEPYKISLDIGKNQEFKFSRNIKFETKGGVSKFPIKADIKVTDTPLTAGGSLRRQSAEVIPIYEGGKKGKPITVSQDYFSSKVISPVTAMEFSQTGKYLLKSDPQKPSIKLEGGGGMVEGFGQSKILGRAPAVHAKDLGSPGTLGGIVLSGFDKGLRFYQPQGMSLKIDPITPKEAGKMKLKRDIDIIKGESLANIGKLAYGDIFLTGAKTNMAIKPQIITETISKSRVKPTAGLLIEGKIVAELGKSITTPKFRFGQASLLSDDTVNVYAQNIGFKNVSLQASSEGELFKNKVFTRTKTAELVNQTDFQRIGTDLKIRIPGKIGFPRFGGKLDSGLGKLGKSYKRPFTTFSSPTAVLFGVKASRKQRKQKTFSGLELIGI